MKKLFSFALATALVLVLVPSSSYAQDLNLEKLGGERIFVLATCDTVHAIDGESKCTNYHVKIRETAGVGQEILLNGEPYVIQWMGAGYYTASGRVLQATADNSNTQLSLLEVRPRSGMVHQSTWQDLDGNGSLSVSDAVMVDGRSEVIVDKRLNVRVTPVR